MADQALISCTGISVQFGEEIVLKDLTFTVPKGKHTVLKGESGSGKSTLLKILMGFLYPASGNVYVGDKKETKEIRKITAWLPQDLNLGSGSVWEVIQKPFEFAANLSNEPGRRKVTSTLKEIGLSEENVTKQFRNLSTGQRQRVGLAICHLLDKPLLMLDEPTSALDNVSKQRAADLLLAHTNKTVVSTSHDPFWLDYADKIIEIS